MLSPGAQLGRYRIEEQLGGGSYGSVYRAFDPLVGEPVALKVLRPELSKDTTQMERLRREVLLSRRIDHPAVCRIHDLQQDGDTLFIVMELVEGRTLGSLLDEGPLPPRRAVRIIEQVARALAAAHAAGVLHRDVKPSNVMIRKRADGNGDAAADDDDVTLLDFGIATSEGLEQLTRPGIALGTMGYLALELWEGKPATPATDVFAAGVLLYGSLTTRLPWRGTGVTLPQQMRTVPAAAPSIFAPGVDAALDAIVLKAIATQRADRYQTPREFADALAAWTPASARPTASLPQSKAPLGAPATGVVSLLDAPTGSEEVPAAPRPARERPSSSTSLVTHRVRRLSAPAALALVGAVILAIGAGLAIALGGGGGDGSGRRAIDRNDDDDDDTRPIASGAVDAGAAVVEGSDAGGERIDVVTAPAPGDGDAGTLDFNATDAERGPPDAARAEARRLRAELQRAAERKGLVMGDVAAVDAGLRAKGNVKALQAGLEAAERVRIDRAFVERKLARLQAKVGATGASSAALDKLALQIADDIAGGRYVDANAKLNRALALAR